MEWKKIMEKLDQLIDADRCKEEVYALYETDHWFSYDQCEKTAEHCVEVMKSAGLQEIEMLPLKADGKTFYGDWRLPRAWKAKKGILRYADGEEVADYQKRSYSLVMYSPSTPEGGITAEVVMVDSIDEPAENAGDSLKGKILFGTQGIIKLMQYAHQVGAVGVLSEFVPIIPGIRDSREDFYDDVPWIGMGEMDEYGIFAFHLTPRQGGRLRERLAQGKVEMFAEVETERYDGVCYTVSGALQGTDPSLEEVLVYSHLYEPGANDNASGGAVQLELMKCFQEAIDKGILPRPKRTIRFAMGYECTGSVAYVYAHPERRILCMAAADMVGAEIIDRTRLSICHDVWANWSFSSGAIYAADRLYREYMGEEQGCLHLPFKALTDSMVADPVLGFSGFGMLLYPALSYHSSMDTPDRMETFTLKRCAMLNGTYLYGLAEADEDTCIFLEGEINRQIQEMKDAEQDERRLLLLEDVRLKAVSTLDRLIGEKSEGGAFGSAESCGAGNVLREHVPPMPDYALEKGSRIPVRKVFGGLTFGPCPQLGERARTGWNGPLNIPVFWSDGNRNLWEIAYLTAVELQECTDEEIEAKFRWVSDFYEALVEFDYAEWK